MTTPNSYISPDCAERCPFFLECADFEAEHMLPPFELPERDNTEILERLEEDPSQRDGVDEIRAIQKETAQHIQKAEAARVAINAIYARRLAWERHDVGVHCNKSGPKTNRKGELKCASPQGRRKLGWGVEQLLLRNRFPRDVNQPGLVEITDVTAAE